MTEPVDPFKAVYIPRLSSKEMLFDEVREWERGEEQMQRHPGLKGLRSTRFKILELLLDKVDVNARDEHGRTVLDWVENRFLADWFLERGALPTRMRGDRVEQNPVSEYLSTLRKQKIRPYYNIFEEQLVVPPEILLLILQTAFRFSEQWLLE